MIQSYFGSIDTDKGIATILSNFDSQYIVDVINDSLKMRFRPFNTPMPNMVNVLETQFKELYLAAPDYKDQIDKCRQDTYKEIITIICNFYGLIYSEDINTMTIDQLHGVAFMMYDIFISRFTDYMVDFYISYIIKNVDMFVDMLEKDPDAIRIKDNTMYQSKQFSDPKWILIHQNVNRIIYNMCAFDITLGDLISYFTDYQTSQILLSILSDTGNIFENHYAIFIKNQVTAPSVYTQIKLSLQRRTQESVYIGEF